MVQNRQNHSDVNLVKRLKEWTLECGTSGGWALRSPRPKGNTFRTHSTSQRPSGSDHSISSQERKERGSQVPHGATSLGVEDMRTLTPLGFLRFDLRYKRQHSQHSYSSVQSGHRSKPSELTANWADIQCTYLGSTQAPALCQQSGTIEPVFSWSRTGRGPIVS